MTSRNDEIATLFEGIQRQLREDWREFRDQHHNPSNKGASYEEALAEFLEKYYWGVYEIQTEAVIIDQDLEVFDVFDTGRGENEIDVVGLFESARPRIVFKIGEMSYVPLRGVAFLCEVKSKIDAGRLEKDLSKLEKVTELIDMNGSRWGMAQTGSYTTSHQIRCLIYDENSISSRELVDKVIEYQDAWDILLIVEDNTLLINSTLPIFSDLQDPIANLELEDITGESTTPVEDEEDEVDEELLEELRYKIKREQNFATRDNGLADFLIVLSGSIPRPMGVDTTDVLVNLSNEYRDIKQK